MSHFQRFGAIIVRTRHLLLAGILSAIGSIPIFLSAGIFGYDSSSHVAKTAFLMYSFSHGNFSGWSQFWYSGFQLFYTYSPLTYVLAAVFGAPFNSAIIGMKALIVFSFALSGMGTFELSRDLGIPNKWSIVAALLYSLTSPHILAIFYVGSLTYSLAFALAPFLFLSLRVALRNQTLNSIIIFGIMIGLMIVSNETTSYVLLFPIIAYVLISTPWPRVFRSLLIIIGASIISVLLSAFWLVPYLKMDLSGELNLLTESALGVYPSSNVIHWYLLFIPNFYNTNAGDLGWILVLPGLASIIFYLRKQLRESLCSRARHTSFDSWSFNHSSFLQVTSCLGPTIFMALCDCRSLIFCSSLCAILLPNL